MSEASDETLGPLIRRLREEKGWSQRHLGEMAGYESGAAISILRIEKQGVIPRPGRLDALAQQLGVEPHRLRAAASRGGKDKPKIASDVSARIEKIREEHDRRSGLELDLVRLDEARQRANNGFLLRLHEVAQRITGHVSGPRDIIEAEESEARFRVQFARAGVEHALTNATEGALGLQSLESAIAAGAHTAAMIQQLSSSAGALAGMSAVLRMGQPVARLAVSVGGPLALTAALVGAVVSISTSAANKRQQADLLAGLEKAEAELEDSSRNIEALRAFVPTATRLLEDIELYGSRSLERWERKVGSGPIDFGDLRSAEKEIYLDFIDVAASQIAVETINLHELATLRGPDLAEALEVAEQVLAEARKVVERSV